MLSEMSAALREVEGVANDLEAEMGQEIGGTVGALQAEADRQRSKYLLELLKQVQDLDDTIDDETIKADAARALVAIHTY
jgi:hypothetical protein